AAGSVKGANEPCSRAQSVCPGLFSGIQDAGAPPGWENWPMVGTGPLTTQNCDPLPGPTPAKSSPVATENGVPVRNCETSLIVHPPKNLPSQVERLRKNGNS